MGVKKGHFIVKNWGEWTTSRVWGAYPSNTWLMKSKNTIHQKNIHHQQCIKLFGQPFHTHCRRLQYQQLQQQNRCLNAQRVYYHQLYKDVQIREFVTSLTAFPDALLTQNRQRGNAVVHHCVGKQITRITPLPPPLW